MEGRKGPQYSNWVSYKIVGAGALATLILLLAARFTVKQSHLIAALLLVGCLREFLATGAVFGQQLIATVLLPMAALPSGGFVLLGLLAAGWCAVANLYTDYKHEEVRRLYADRKH